MALTALSYSQNYDMAVELIKHELRKGALHDDIVQILGERCAMAAWKVREIIEEIEEGKLARPN